MLLVWWTKHVWCCHNVVFFLLLQHCKPKHYDGEDVDKEYKPHSIPLRQSVQPSKMSSYGRRANRCQPDVSDSTHHFIKGNTPVRRKQIFFSLIYTQFPRMIYFLHLDRNLPVVNSVIWTWFAKTLPSQYKIKPTASGLRDTTYVCSGLPPSNKAMTEEIRDAGACLAFTSLSGVLIRK